MIRGLSLIAAALAATGAQAQDRADVQQITSTSGQPVAGSLPATDKDEAPVQLSPTSESQPEQAQLTKESDSRRPPPAQVATGPRTAEPPQPLSSPAEGRTASVDRVEGDDRCDPASDEDRRSPECRDILENRAAEFERKRAQMSPEERILLDRQLRSPNESIADATRRLARSGDDNSLEAMGVASIVLARPAPEKPEKEKDPTAEATAEAIANFLKLPPPQQ